MNSYILHILTNGGGGKNTEPIAQKVSLSLVLGTLTVMWGIWLRTSAHKALGRHFTFHVSLQKDHTLITDWPYNVVRHPGYTGALMIYGGLATVLAGTDTWARAFFWGHLGMQGGLIGAFVFLAIALPVISNSLAVVMLFKRMAAEDKMLQQRFGPKWDRWAQDVPYKLVPWMY
jgi:protein-S-isoprenylcysteine O-methyltransferase Ste14